MVKCQITQATSRGDISGFKHQCVDFQAKSSRKVRKELAETFSFGSSEILFPPTLSLSGQVGGAVASGAPSATRCSPTTTERRG